MNHTQAKLYTIASGKGGVGKTSLTLNLAASAGQLGKRVLVVDGDTGLANADVQLNL
ncbi:MAG: AAA family ATPase, partial [Pseudomonadota bacterium]